MNTKLLNGKKLADKIKKKIAKTIKEKFLKFNKKPPHLGIILVGDNPSSIIYVNNKIKECKKIGIKSTLIHLPKESKEKEIINEIYKMNKNIFLDGFIVQLPLENHINKNKILLSINPNKDVDGFHPENFGKMILGISDGFFSATALGIITLLIKNNIKIQGKNIVVIGRSITVGRPISILMSKKWIGGNGTVTLIHSKTYNMEFYTKKADIVVVSIGKPSFIKGNMIKKGSIIIDVGINNILFKNKKKIFGDVDYNSVYGKASYLTPVPGGIGPMTIVMLLKNTLKASLKRIKK